MGGAAEEGLPAGDPILCPRQEVEDNGALWMLGSSCHHPICLLAGGRRKTEGDRQELTPPPQPESCLHSCSPRAPRERGDIQDWESGSQVSGPAALCGWPSEDPPPQAGSLAGWNPSLLPECGEGVEARVQPERQQTTGRPCAHHRGVPISHPLPSILAWDPPSLGPSTATPRAQAGFSLLGLRSRGANAYTAPLAALASTLVAGPCSSGPHGQGFVCFRVCVQEAFMSCFPLRPGCGGRGEQDSPSSC